MNSLRDSQAPGRDELDAPMSDREAANARTREGTEDRVVVPAQDARQAVTGQNVRYVLGFSLAAVVIAFAAIFFIYLA